jgi:hypothetical protein
MSVILKASGGGSVTLQEPSTASDYTLSLPATTGTVVVSGTTPSLNGITFPATQSASSDANTLDDYEEGTWTIAIQGSSSNPTVGYNFRVGTYVKIGRNVTLNGHFRTSSVSGGSGDVLITGLPFAVDNTSSYTTVGVCYVFNTATGKFPYYVRLDNGGTSITLYYGSGTVQSTSLVVSDLGTGNFSNETAFTINYLATA